MLTVFSQELKESLWTVNSLAPPLIPNLNKKKIIFAFFSHLFVAVQR